MKTISREDFAKAFHPNEESRFFLAIIICIPVLIFGMIITYNAFWEVVLLVGFIAFFFWFTVNIIKVSLIANSVQVSNLNFSNVFDVCEEIKSALEYDGDVKMFITDEGGFNAFLYKFLRTKFIILTSSLVEDMSKEKNKQQLVWIIARFIGALKAKHYRMDFLRILIESIDRIKFFSIFILPYERATQYTGDNIGLLVCEDIDQVMMAFDKFLVGKKLSEKVNFEGVIEQKKSIQNSFFAFVARLGSTHPHQIDRHLNLLAFAKKMFPEQFTKFTSKYGTLTTLEIENVLPPYM